MAGEAGEAFARARALAVLRIRGAALGAALLPAAAAVVLHVASATGRLGQGWDAARWGVTAVACVVLAAAAAMAAVMLRAKPAPAPTVPVTESAAPDLYRMVRDLAERLHVPAPEAIELTPDCDSWLEPGDGRPGRLPGPVLVIGSPFLWWMRIAELRALLAPVVAGTGAAADPEIAAARRFVRGLDTAAGIAAAGRWAPLRPAYALLGWTVRLLLRGCRVHAGEMERGVAAAASERAQAVDYGLRIVAQEQVGLAYAGWDRLLTRVALPAWRMGRWPARLDAGVVAALTDLSRRDRLAEGFESRLGERPACDLLEEPGVVDEAVSLLAARLFHAGPERAGGGWAPVSWARYPEEVVERIWRSDAARLIRVLSETHPLSVAPALSPVYGRGRGVLVGETGGRVTLAAVLDRVSPPGRAEELSARLDAAVGRAAALGAAGGAGGTGLVDELVPRRTGRDLLADHVAAVVCCAALDSAGARPGLDWLDGPALLVAGSRRTDLAGPVLGLVEHGDPASLREWLAATGIPLDVELRLDQGRPDRS
ncbi:hypothetical protein [Actinacidiphila acidipaludis]|uniref:Peptidase M48 domain-containing protein n=1 Tax=Actinacidiphila acidipaludis TaxID=2873382 RepID=A0ABS7Q2S5_9ACTN|nr:hypothetical protein [Streptomyces acidipaludis]MBY8877446.1 hypothetical protein [Streptomyces acidipaludis]